MMTQEEIDQTSSDFMKAIQDFCDRIKIKSQKRGSMIMRTKKSFRVNSRKWNKTYFSNYISKF